MESKRELDGHEHNVFSLDRQRRMRNQRDVEVEPADGQFDFDGSISEVQCDAGVCSIVWRPKKKNAA